jgi:hypothetical protein
MRGRSLTVSFATVLILFSLPQQIGSLAMFASFALSPDVRPGAALKLGRKSERQFTEQRCK